MRFVDDVVDRATEVDWRRILVFLVSVIPYLVAWTVGKVVVGLLTAFSWVIAASKAGYTAARGDR